MRAPPGSWLLIAAIMATPSPALAAVDVYFCVTGVTGPCSFNGGSAISNLASDGWLPVQSISMGVSNVPPASNPYGPGANTPRPTEVVRALDSRSPVLALAALQGQTFTSIKVLWRRATAQPPPPHTFLVMTNARVVRVQTSSTDAANGMETLVLDASSYALSTWRISQTGQLGNPPTVATWTGGVP